MSQPKLHRIAPTRSPMFAARERNGPLKWNSLSTGESIRPVNSYNTGVRMSSGQRAAELQHLTGQTLSLYAHVQCVRPHQDFCMDRRRSKTRTRTIRSQLLQISPTFIDGRMMNG